MKFAYPLFLILIPILVLGGILLQRLANRTSAKRLRLFGPTSRLASILPGYDPKARTWKNRMVLAGLLLLVSAIAAPMFGPKKARVDQLGAEFYLILDISNSMLVRDVSPNRLVAIQESLDSWLKTRTGDRIGLVLVAGDAFVQAPLTSDMTALREVLAQANPSNLSIGGTNLGAALQVTAEALQSSDQTQKIAVVISDGENLEGDPVGLTKRLRNESGGKLTIHTIGVGTPTGGKVPLYRKGMRLEEEAKTFVKDEYGAFAQSRLDERMLRRIAEAGGGKYVEYQPDGKVWDDLYNQSIQSLARKIDVRDLMNYVQLYQLPLLFAMMLFAWDAAFPLRRRHLAGVPSIVQLPSPAAVPPAQRLERSRTKARVISIATALVFPIWSMQALTVSEAEVLVQAGKADEAASMLRAVAQTNPEDLFTLYNYGVAAYAAGHYKEAAQAFAEVAGGGDASLSSLALNQIGNAEFRLGEELAKARNMEGQIIAWQRAVESYQSSLSVKARSATRKNLETVSNALEELLLKAAEAEVKTAQNQGIPLPTKERGLSKAVDYLVSAEELSPSNKETSAKLEKARELHSEALTEQARQARKDAKAAREQLAKAGSQPDPKRKAQRAIDDAMGTATSKYEQAIEQRPKNSALQAEYQAFKKEAADAALDAAAETLKAADAAQDPKPSAEFVKKQALLNEALSQIEGALGIDPTSSRGEAMKQAAMTKLEQAYMARGDLHKASGDSRFSTQPAATVRDYSVAMENYLKAAELNPANTKAHALAAETAEKLAQAFTASGKASLAQAAETGRQQSSPANLQQQVGQVEAASQSFSQAETLAPGKNNAAALQSEAADLLAKLRAELDAALAAQLAESGKGDQREPGESASEPSAASPADGQANKPPLSFADIRAGTEREGQFKDLSTQKKIRNW